MRGRAKLSVRDVFLVDRGDSSEASSLYKRFEGPLKWRMMQAASDFLSIVIVVIPTFQKAEKKQKAQCL